MKSAFAGAILIVVVFVGVIVFFASQSRKPCTEGQQWAFGNGTLMECRKVWTDKDHTGYWLQWVKLYPSKEDNAQ